MATGLAGLVLLLPGSPLSAAVARAAHACTAAFDAAYTTPGGSTAGGGARCVVIVATLMLPFVLAAAPAAAAIRAGLCPVPAAAP